MANDELCAIRKLIETTDVSMLKRHYDEQMMRNVDQAKCAEIESDGALSDDWFVAGRQLVRRRILFLETGVALGDDGKTATVVAMQG